MAFPLIVLDTTPLGLAVGPPHAPLTVECLAWLRALESSEMLVAVPEVADYEVRREMIRNRAEAGLRRLDDLHQRLLYLPITTPAMRQAAELWALLRRQG